MLNSVRFMLAIAIGKILIKLLGWAGRGTGGTSLPGKVALHICPGLIASLADSYGQLVIVTGTNGKTTTTMAITEVVGASGAFRVVTSNGEGANMLSGLATALLRDQPLLRDIHQHRSERVAVLEVDEGSLEKFCRQSRVDTVIATNLFRDQLDRYWEIGRLADSMQVALGLHPRAKLILNADDPAITHLGSGRENVVYYGLKPPEEENRFPGYTQALPISGEARDNTLCPACNTPLNYTHYVYSHLGEYRCPHCGLKRPQPYYLGEMEPDHPGRENGAMAVRFGEVTLRLETSLTGMYNYYNLLAAAVAALEMGVEHEVIAKALGRFSPGQGRSEVFSFPGVRCTLMLTKNPTGMSEALRAVAQASRKLNRPSVMFAINDLAADGRDVSWLWDSSWGVLLETDWEKVICSGLRSRDMAVCLKYFGVDPAGIEVIPPLRAALSQLLKKDDDQDLREVYILSTYTNLTPCRNILKEMGGTSSSETLVKDMPSLSRTA